MLGSRGARYVGAGVLVALTAACGGDMAEGALKAGTDALVGRWYPVHGHQADRVQFLKDGSMLAGSTLLGKYSFVEEGLLKVSPEIPEGAPPEVAGAPKMFSASAEGDVLRLCPPGSADNCKEFFRYAEETDDALWKRPVDDATAARLMGEWQSEGEVQTIRFKRSGQSLIAEMPSRYSATEHFRVRVVRPDYLVLRTQDSCRSHGACYWTAVDLSLSTDDSGAEVLSGRQRGTGMGTDLTLRRVSAASGPEPEPTSTPVAVSVIDAAPVAVVPVTGDGSLESQVQAAFPGSSIETDFGSGDFDADGREDRVVLISSAGAQHIVVIWGKGGSIKLEERYASEREDVQVKRPGSTVRLGPGEDPIPVGKNDAIMIYMKGEGALLRWDRSRGAFTATSR